MVKKFTSKQIEIAKKNCYASSKAVPNFGNLIISFAVHVINQPEKTFNSKNTSKTSKLRFCSKKYQLLRIITQKMISCDLKFGKTKGFGV